MNADQNQRNTAIVEKAYQDFGRGDINAILAALHPQVEWVNPAGETIPTGGTRRGVAQVGEFFRTVAQTWEFLSFEPKQYVASGDQVIVLGSYRARSRATGNAADSDWAMVWNVGADGKIVRFQEFTDTATLAACLLPQAATAAR